MKKTCPRCNANINSEKINVDLLSVPVTGCTNCGGFLADYNEAENIIADPASKSGDLKGEQEALGPDAEKELLGMCPNCDSKFEHVILDFELTKGKVHLDQCTGCNGIWFDKGELREIFELALKEASMMGSMGDNLETLTNTKETLFTCPRCNSEESAAVGEVMDMEIIKCKKCNGIWLSGEQLEEMIGDVKNMKVNNKDIKSEGEGANEAGMCPKCKVKLSKWENLPDNLDKLIIDYCSSCHGLWFDKGEFNSFLKIFSGSPFQQAESN